MTSQAIPLFFSRLPKKSIDDMANEMRKKKTKINRTDTTQPQRTTEKPVFKVDKVVNAKKSQNERTFPYCPSS
jgi:hypothetical protein